MTKKQFDFSKMLSAFLNIIVAVALVASTYIFVKGQFDANQAIIEAGTAVVESLKSDNSEQMIVAYNAAISYLEAQQQAYSENSVIKIISLIYALSSSIILGYGAKMLRLGASDKKELCEELLEKTENQFNKSSNAILRHHTNVYTAVISCENVAQLSFLLVSYFAQSNGSVTRNSDIEDRLEVELLRSLQQFGDFLLYCREKENRKLLTEHQLETIFQSWGKTKRSINEYIGPMTNGQNSVFQSVFGKYDYEAVKNLVQTIEKSLDLLKS